MIQQYHALVNISIELNSIIGKMLLGVSSTLRLGTPQQKNPRGKASVKMTLYKLMEEEVIQTY